ncbi:MAG TPA: dephospho-CoA kinase [Dehalococcoidia bacterium]|nr:dephospho-CoA kinase [Chloroflexota bacterium]HCE76608.1 dephospho-CoA kinase [Dehalococcoidia bacterium]|tara:strand:+ start:26 stop:625 length:600 start_codon:yes stop_codon:yes gene_type:complete
MLSIGLTGGIGTGKSLVSNILNDLGATVVNADLLGHEAYLPGTVGFDMVVDSFGDQIVGDDGTVDRKKLGPIVFSSSQNMAKLNAIMHPLIRNMIQAQLEEYSSNGTDVVVVEAAVLIEANWVDLFDEVWVVTSDKETVIERLKDRNSLSREDAIIRIDSQMSTEERIDHSDVVISNDKTIDELTDNVEKIWNTRVVNN